VPDNLTGLDFPLTPDCFVQPDSILQAQNHQLIITNAPLRIGEISANFYCFCRYANTFKFVFFYENHLQRLIGIRDPMA
jgi:hypothetical protein